MALGKKSQRKKFGTTIRKDVHAAVKKLAKAKGRTIANVFDELMLEGLKKEGVKIK